MVQKSEDAPRYGRRKPIDWRRARGMLRMVLSLGLLILAVSQSAHARYYTVINPGSVKVYKGSLFEACKHSRDVNYPSFQKLVSVEYYNDIGSGKVGGVFCKWQGQYPAPIPITHGKIECDAGEYVDDSAYLGCRKIEPEPFCSIDEPVVGGAAGGQGGSAAAPASRAPFSAGVDVGSGTPHVNAGDFGATQSVHGGVGGMSRTYSPLNKSGGATGVGWSTPVDRSVTALASTPVTVPDARGWMTSFKTTTGGFAPAYWNAISFSGSRTDVNRSLTSFSNNGWQFRNESGIFETYGANGALGQIRDDRTGEALTLVRSPSRPAILLRDQYGRTMTASQGANGLIDKLIDSSGREIIYQYVDRGGPWAGITVAPNVGANKILSKVIYPDNTPATLTDNPAHTYEYSDANFPDNLTGIRDERGVLVLFIAYDAQGRVTEMSGAGGANRKTIAYDVVANTRTVTNALGKSTVYQLEIAQGHYRVTAINGQPSANCAAANTAYAYDAIGFKNQETSAEGIVTKLQNDGKGRVLTRTDDFGGANARAVTTAWNTAFEQPAVVTEPNRTTTYNRDAAGRLLSVTVADTTTHTVPYSTNGQQRTWTNAYASLPAGLPSEPYGATALVVVNGDAETNSLFGWTVNDGSYTVIATNAATNAASKAFKSGNAAVNRMSQTIALPTARNAQIDAGLAMVTANWFQRGSSAANNDDPVTVEMTFLNSGGSPIGAMIASPAKAANNAWTAREFSALAPANARSVKIGLVCTIAYAATNTVCNADIDDLTLAIGVGVTLPVVNGGAQANNTSGWTLDAGAFASFTPTIPSGDGSAPAFFGGASAASSRMSQIVALPASRTTQIDQGVGEMTLRWLQQSANQATNDDTGWVDLTFLDASGGAIGAPIESIRLADLSTAWTARDFKTPVPVSARSVKIALNCFRNATTSCDARFDGVSASYSEFGPSWRQLASVDGPLAGAGDKTNYEYDSNGYLKRVVNPLGHATDILSVNSAGQPTSVRDPNNVTTNFTYSPRGFVETITVNPGAGQAVTAFEYDVGGYVTKMTPPDGAWLSFTYDNARRVTSVSNAAGEQIAYVYDLLGNVTRTDRKNSGGTIVATMQSVYDELGRLMKDIGAANQQTLYAYDRDDRMTSATDPRSELFAYAYDGLNRLVRETDPDLGETDQTYNGNDEPLSLTDAEDLTTTYVRNGFGEIIRTTSPDTGVADLVRDARGLVTQMTDARGKVTQYQYDLLERMTAETYPAAPSQNITYGYDSTAGGNKGVGRLTSVTDGAGSISFVYDAFGRVTAQARVIGGQSYTTAYSYDAAGKALSVTHPSGRIVAYAYNTIGSPSAVGTRLNAGAPLTDILTSIAHAPMSMTGSAGMDGDYGLWNIASGIFGNGLNLAVARDLDGRMTSITAAPNSGPAVQSLAFTYDPAGNIATIDDAVTPSRNQTFSHDSLNRLTRGVGVYGTIDYSYDLVGNRTAKLWNNGTSTYGETYSYAAGTHRLASISAAGSTTRTMSYAASGQLSTDQKNGTTYAYIYDDAGRLIEARNGTTPIATYAYDAFEQRSLKTTTAAAPGGASNVHFIHDEFGRLIAEHNGATGAVLREYLWLGMMPVAYVDYSSGSAITYYVHTDQVMNPQKLTDASGAIVWDRVAEPFGVEIAATGGLTLPSRFPGQYHDAETGFSQNWNRDYDPFLGRYIQSDPIGLLGGVNTYAYVGGNPLVEYDQLGLEGIGPWNSAQTLGDLGRVHGSSLRNWYNTQRDWRQWGHDMLGGHENSFQRHCSASCALARTQGAPVTRAVGFGNEVQGFVIHDVPRLPSRLLGITPWAFSFADFAANEAGFQCAQLTCDSKPVDEIMLAVECRLCCAKANWQEND